jgi:hypothetical protein
MNSSYCKYFQILDVGKLCKLENNFLIFNRSSGNFQNLQATISNLNVVAKRSEHIFAHFSEDLIINKKLPFFTTYKLLYSFISSRNYADNKFRY